MAASWTGPRPETLQAVSDDPWRTTGDTVERIELLALDLVADVEKGAAAGHATRAVLDEIRTRLAPAVAVSGADVLTGRLAGLDRRG
jgi:cobaltochelatase CobN